MYLSRGALFKGSGSYKTERETVRRQPPLKCYAFTNFALLYTPRSVGDLPILTSFLTFRVETPSFVTGALVTTLAFFVAFNELIKLFFSIVINHSSNLDCGSTMTGKKGLSFDGPFECEFRGVKQA